MIVHWDGHTLRTFKALKPYGIRELKAIAAASPSDVWAVGVDIVNDPAVMHWDGHGWKVVPTPPLPSGEASLDGVVAISAQDVWTVGVHSPPGGAPYTGGNSRPLVLHWNGKRWRSDDVRAVAPKGSGLAAVDAASSSDVWAVGTVGGYDWDELVLHWNGHRWSRYHSVLADEGLRKFPQQVDVFSPQSVWMPYFFDESPVIVRWQGSKSRVAYTYSGDQDRFWNDIGAVAPNSVWAVGYAYANGRRVSAGHALGREVLAAPAHTFRQGQGRRAEQHFGCDADRHLGGRQRSDDPLLLLTPLKRHS